MATLVETNKVYHCQCPNIAAASIQVIGGTVTIKGSNVTKYDPETKKLIVPDFSELVETEDEELEEGIHLFSNLPEFIGFEGSATEIWIKMGIDGRIKSEE